MTRTRSASDSVKDTLESIDTEKLKEQAAQAAATAQSAATQLADQAKDAAVHAKEWGTPKVEAFLEWLQPRVEKAWQDSIQAAAPRVEKAATKAAPAIDTAHDRLVEDVLPKIVASVLSLIPV